MATESDDELELSSSTLDALRSFYAERDDHARRFAELKAAVEEAPITDQPDGESAAGTSPAAATGAAQLSMSAFTEDWNESQFWYSDETANLFARQLLSGADALSTIAVVSAPSVFVALKNTVSGLPQDQRPRLILLEHDNRFAVFGSEFVHYDFRQPTKLPASLRGCADRMICDPPFLSEDCQTKTALTMRWLAKSGIGGKSNGTASGATSSTSSFGRVLICTGERMSSLIETKLYRAQGVRTTTYEPQHARGLSNEFLCYANFECEDWKWREEDGKAAE